MLGIKDILGTCHDFPVRAKRVVTPSTIVISFVRVLVTVSKLNKQTMITKMTITSHQRLASVMKEFWCPLLQ